MQVERHFAVRVHAIGIKAGEAFGDTYGREVRDPANIGQVVSECVASALSDGMRVHSVIVDPITVFVA